ncbi:hypothetical protein PUMCH_002648 [Australozyma saopauloensis]|uniref:Uncharacterized protein n=1 Tax=Australozyma saopauloensis TaxID=291208 RepID=A0AAX4H9W1_9ASCO|nr:hypothetical protein PUMCH_002648 [[Candida] saopauloensis]
MADRSQYENYRFRMKSGKDINGYRGDVDWSDLVKDIEKKRTERITTIPYEFQLDHYPDEAWCNKWQVIFDLASEGLNSDSMKCFQGHRQGYQEAIISDFNTLRLAHASHIDSLSKMNRLSSNILKEHPIEWVRVIEKYNEAFNEMKPKIDANIDRVEDPSAKAAVKIAFGQIKLYHIHWCEQTTWYYKSYLQPVWAILHSLRKLIQRNTIMSYSFSVSRAILYGAIGAVIGLPNRTKLFKVPFSEAKGVHVSFIIMMVSLCVYILVLVLYWKIFRWAANDGKLYLGGQLAQLAEENWNYRAFPLMPPHHKFFMFAKR